MRQELFERWDWEADRGVRPLPEGTALPASYAAAYYDRLGRLYRVEVREQAAGPGVDTGRGTTESYLYDYFCDAGGRVIQKRALGPNDEVELIVDFEYDLEKSQVSETAWWPGQGVCKSRKRPIPTE
jgi:hypothetical protein